MSTKNRFLVITIPFVVLSLLHLCYGLGGPATASIITKGLPILFLLVSACIWGKQHPWVIAALFFSLLGDESTELINDLTTARYFQISFFAVAQISYIKEFLRFRPKRLKSEGTMLSALPVFCCIYGLLLSGNVASACIQKRKHKWTYVLGAWLFLISDSTILMGMLKVHIPYRGLIIMSTYYLAQYLLTIRCFCEESEN